MGYFLDLLKLLFLLAMAILVMPVLMAVNWAIFGAFGFFVFLIRRAKNNVETGVVALPGPDLLVSGLLAGLSQVRHAWRGHPGHHARIAGGLLNDDGCGGCCGCVLAVFWVPLLVWLTVGAMHYWGVHV